MNIELRIANYIARYAPSEKKLREYLTKKKFTGDITLLLSGMGYDEDMMCDMWIRTFLSRSTGEREARIKLYKKWFPKDLIETKITSSLEEIRDWSSHSSEIESKITSLIKKGKSTQVISLLLTSKYPYFRNEIRELLLSFSDDTGLQKEIEKYMLKYNLKIREEKQKFYAALQRKWFHYEDIKTALEEVRE